MAFHERLSRTQQILLAVFCCPLLPFYLCYLCCCGSKEEKNDKEKGHELERAEEGKSSLSRQRDPTYSHTSPGKDAKKNETISYDNKGFIDEKNKQNSTQKAYHVYQVPIEINEENTTPTLSKKNSLGKGKETKKNDKNLKKSFDNKGFIADNKKKEISVKTAGFAYPWDQSSLKSLQVDLKKFKQLDVFASQVSTRSSVEVLVKELLQKAQTDLEKLRAIWMWVTHHIEYDVKGYYNTELRTGVPGDVLQSGKAVCAGYAGLFKEMCRFAGINCVMVSGHSKGFSYEPGDRFTGSGNHAWNAVSLEGRWHLLDSTWGAGNVNSNCSQFTFQYNEFYFLTHPALFIGDHFPLKDEWQLLNPRVSFRQFEKALMKMSGFYSCDLHSINPDSSLIETVNGKATITVKSQSPALFTHTLNKKKECGIITLTADGMILDIYPKSTGKHKLSIFAKPFDATETYDCVCEYQLQCESVHKEMKLPSAMMNPVGPSWLTEIEGLLQPSQCSPIVYTQDGRCAFRFLLEKDLSFVLKLSLENVNVSDDLSRHVFIYREGNWVQFKIQIPRAGMYLFTIFAKEKSAPGKNHHFVCNYLISCSNPSVQWPVFPLVYTSWQQEYELVEPLSGVLPAQRTLQFKVKIPGVAKVLVGSRDTQELSVSSDGYWTGSCSTADCKDLTVMVLHKPNDSSYSLVLQYQVENN